MTEQINNFLKRKSIYLPIYGYIFNKDSALSFLNLLKSTSYYILGGDVLIKDDVSEYHYTYDSWYSDPPHETQKESIEKALNYIKNYPNKDNIYFTLVWK